MFNNIHQCGDFLRRKCEETKNNTHEKKTQLI